MPWPRPFFGRKHRLFCTDSRKGLGKGLQVGLGLVLAAGCARLPAQADDGGNTATPDGAPTPVRAHEGSGGLSQQTAQRETERILAEVARTRNLEVTREVEVNVIDKEGIRDFARESMYEHTTPQELLRMGRIESSLGVIPPGSDAEAIILDMLEDGVLGLYDPKTRTLFIGDFIPAAMLSMVVGHEIVHGLQDMHFDLEKHQKPLLHRGDAESARRFLIEGEAQAAYLAWVSGETGLAGIDDAVLDAMGNQTLELADEVSEYPILARSLQMPYADGTATVIRLVRTEGWDAVDAMYADLPQSTEQMLHIDKLKAREPAVAVELDAAPLAQVLGLTEIWYDDIGEAALLAMLADVEGALAARRAAAGWGGDRYVAFDRSGAKALPVPVVVAATVWDTVDDAKEFEVSFRKYLDQTIGKGVFIARRGDAVVFATGIPPEIEPASIEQVVWTSMRKGRPSK